MKFNIYSKANLLYRANRAIPEDETFTATPVLWWWNIEPTSCCDFLSSTRQRKHVWRKWILRRGIKVFWQSPKWTELDTYGFQSTCIKSALPPCLSANVKLLLTIIMHFLCILSAYRLQHRALFQTARSLNDIIATKSRLCRTLPMSRGPHFDYLPTLCLKAGTSRMFENFMLNILRDSMHLVAMRYWFRETFDLFLFLHVYSYESFCRDAQKST